MSLVHADARETRKTEPISLAIARPKKALHIALMSPGLQTGRPEQPSGWMVRFHRRSVGRKRCTRGTS
jgi:hypothetical protein